jgi:uncharacterized membrane protein
MARRSRILSFGCAAALVLAGAASAVLVGGLAGELLTISLMSLGLAGALLLVFLEIGLSDERAVERDEQSRRRRERRALSNLRRVRLLGRPRRPL